ncbi:hypothetical protein B0H12DRAFT_1322795 [Mycena haematopus]|nr:hypothetical protein B0H12DRAFT_1322795 [Mycena haematopus]
MRFSPILTLWNRHRRMRPSSPSIAKTPLDGRCALPMELWNRIFLHLDDDALFVVAAVCRPFNDRSVRIALFTNGITSSGLDTGDLTVPSRLLPILLRAAFIPRITNLSCVFEESNLSLHLRMIGALVAQSPNLNSVELRFPSVELDVHPHRVWLLDDSKHGVFCTVVSTMVAHTPRDIILVSERHCLRCSTQDLFTYLVSNYDEPPTEKSREIYPIKLTTSLKLHFQRDRLGGLRPFTMLVVNGSTTESLPIESFTLGFRPFGFGDPDCSRLSVAHLSAILPKITLPHLHTLTIVASHIDPSALEDFLSRHPQVQNIRDMRRTPSPSALFHHPPALPNLWYIEASTTTNLLSWLVATAPSPPRTISVPFAADDGRSARSSLFHYLSERNTPAELEISCDTKFTETDFALARSLYCVDAVLVLCSSVQHGAALLPWLNTLPALSAVQFFPLVTSADDFPFLELARTSLARPGMDIRVEVVRQRALRPS